MADVLTFEAGRFFWKGLFVLSRTCSINSIKSRAAVIPCRSLCTKQESNDGLRNEEILKFIVCPLTKKPLKYDKKRNYLISEEINVAYRIVNGIPNLIPQEAIKLDDCK